LQSACLPKGKALNGIDMNFLKHLQTFKAIFTTPSPGYNPARSFSSNAFVPWPSSPKPNWPLALAPKQFHLQVLEKKKDGWTDGPWAAHTSIRDSRIHKLNGFSEISI